MVERGKSILSTLNFLIINIQRIKFQNFSPAADVLAEGRVLTVLTPGPPCQSQGQAKRDVHRRDNLIQASTDKV